jgi:adenylyltransferase/sulfurtransferase
MGLIVRNKFLLRLTVGEHQLTIFPDGRTIVGGTEDVALARTLQARYVGS